LRKGTNPIYIESSLHAYEQKSKTAVQNLVLPCIISNLGTPYSPKRLRLQLLLRGSKKPPHLGFTGGTFCDCPSIPAIFGILSTHSNNHDHFLELTTVHAMHNLNRNSQKQQPSTKELVWLTASQIIIRNTCRYESIVILLQLH
jgi:hypothetical protein